MIEDPEIFGVIAEWKEEGPIVMEGALLTYEKAHASMKALAARANVIRVAIFKAVHKDGNNTLIPQESQP